MVAVSYPRGPLTVLPVRGADADEVLSFLNRYGAERYEHSEAPEVSGEDRATSIYVRSAADRSTIIGLLPSTVLIHDPERGGIQFAYSVEALDRFGVDRRKLYALLDRSDHGDPRSY